MVWNAEKYSKHSQIQHQIGIIAIEKLNPHSGETILDLGCGIGNLTKIIAQRLGNGKILGIDKDKNMINAAQDLIAINNIQNFEVLEEDVQNFSRKQEFDAIFSNIVIHWVKDQKLLFTKIYDALKPNGRILFASIYTDPNYILDGSSLNNKLSAGKKINMLDVEMETLQTFIQQGHHLDILSMEEFLAYQPRVFCKNLNFYVFFHYSLF